MVKLLPVPVPDGTVRFVVMPAPSTAGTAPELRVINIDRGHRPLSVPPAGAKYPRATVRPVPGLVAGKPVWVAKIWKDYCCPVEIDGRPLSVVKDSLSVAWTWAEAKVDASRFWQMNHNQIEATPCN